MARVVLGGRASAGATRAAPSVGLSWLLRVRWGAVVGQVGAIVGAWWLGASLPVGALLGVVAIAASTNAALTLALRRRALATRTMAATLMGDTVLLTALLWLSGGASNPFSVFYLVHVVLAALLLDGRWTIGLAVFTSLAFGALFFAPADHAHHMHGDFSAHLQGMWISYSLAAGFLGYFVWRLARALADRERQLEALRRSAARSERLASLSVLAAGAAHELGSPLGTIAVTARELERACDQGLETEAVRDDARLLRSQAERCRAILERLAAQSGESTGEALVELTTSEVVGEVVAALDRERGGRLVVDERFRGTLRAPRRALVQALLNLVHNAFDAVTERADGGRVELRVEEAGGVRWTVADDGPGVSGETLERLGEPFFTTKAPGRGMGLGLYLVGSLAERLGGALQLSSGTGQGMQASLLLPHAALRSPERTP